MAQVYDDLVYDIGLHRGEDTDFYLRKGYRVIGFEANPDLAEQCQIRFQDAIAAGRLHIVEGAIAPAEEGETISFFVNPHSAWGTMHRQWVDRNDVYGRQSREITVPRADIFEAYARFGMPHYMKIDIEGSDIFVLESLREMDAKPRNISIESQKVDYGQLRKEINLLAELGYSRFRAVQQAEIPGKCLRTQTLDGRNLEHFFENHASGAFGEDLAQPWLGSDEVLSEYEAIFRRYRTFGDSSLYPRAPYRVQKLIEQAYRKGTGLNGPLVGWFDTHAAM